MTSHKSPTSPSALRRLVGMLTDRNDPWRREFLVLRGLNVLAERGILTETAQKRESRFEAGLRERPRSIVPYLQFRQKRYGRREAMTYAQELSSSPHVSAEELAEIARFHYVIWATSLGDAYLEQAKRLDPGHPAIYAEEADNQRARGNLHRELQAVEQSILLSGDRTTRQYWRFRKGEVLLLQHRFEEAWEQFEDYARLPRRSEQALSAAYCARKLGRTTDVVSAYRHALPIRNGFDAEAAAYAQLYEYRRPDEASALLDESGDLANAPTGLLETGFMARMQLGDVEGAVELLELANARDDSGDWVGGALGTVYELTDRAKEALSQYELLEKRALTPLTRFRRSVLLADQGRLGEAVTRYLRGADTARDVPDKPSDNEVDPQLPMLLGKLRQAETRADRIPLLNGILRRASEPELMRACAHALADSLASTHQWEDAWTAIRTAQAERLPSMPLIVHPDAREREDFSRDMYYAEVCETEPLSADTVLFESSLGATTSCSPLAVCLAMLQDPRHAEKLYVWSITTSAQIHPALRDLPNVVFVRKGSIGHLRYLATAAAIVNNSTIEYCFAKRDGQRYLNTWHGVPWKSMGRDNHSEPFAYGNITRNFLQADVVLGPDPHTIDVLSRGHDVDELVPDVFTIAGYPRNDLTLNLPVEQRERIRRELGVAPGESLVLFMPTWKGLFNERDAEIDEVVDAARRMNAPGLVIAVRAHHYVRSNFDAGTNPDGFVFVPEHFDTNELIGAADALVTDFSSVLFDAAATGVPVVKLTADLERYSQERGLYFTADEVPGANASSADEAQELLLAAVADRDAFVARYADRTARFSFPERGESAKRAIDLLFGEAPAGGAIAPSGRKPVLLSTGGLPPNGITRAVRNLLVALDGTDYSPYLIPGSNTLQGADTGTLADLRRYARLLVHVGSPAGTHMEREVLRYFDTRYYARSTFATDILTAGRKRQARRKFGAARFFSAVEYSAYSSTDVALISYGAPVEGGARGIIFHNEMWKETQFRYPRLAAGMQTLDDFDFCASVSNGVRDYNAETMLERFGVPKDKHITVENTINAAEILDLANSPLDPEDLDWYESPGAHACVVARLSPEKNHGQLLEALASCRGDLSRPVKITCLGDGPLRLDLERRIGELGLSDLVRLRGLVPNPQAHLKAAGAMILPSLHEGQPLVILEALTVGAPVVATRTPGSESVLHDGEFGALVPISFDGLVEALNRVADGRLAGSIEFDADRFTANSLQMFVNAIDPTAGAAA